MQVVFTLLEVIECFPLSGLFMRRFLIAAGRVGDPRDGSKSDCRALAALEGFLVFPFPDFSIVPFRFGRLTLLSAPPAR